MHHPHIYAFSGVSLKGYTNELINTSYQKLPFGSGDDPDKLFEWTTTWLPVTELYIHAHTWANRGELYELIIRQDHLHNIQAYLPGVSYIL